MNFKNPAVKFFYLIILTALTCSNIFSQTDSSFNVLNYDLNLNLYKCFVKPYARTFTATEIISINTNNDLGQITLNADNTSLNIDSVGGAGLSFIHENNLLIIKLDRIYKPGDVFDIKILYRHKDIKDSALYVSNGLAYTDCESSRARRWFPCKDIPSDKALLTLTARVPSNVLLGSNGVLVDSTQHGDTISYKWVSQYPIATYLVAFAGKVKYNLDVINWVRPNGENMQIRFYWQSGETIFNLTNIKTKVGKMLDLFSLIYGDYPFEKLAFATTNTEFPWGGMENQTLITLCPDCWTEDLICHEIVHQWFGDMITPMTWADIWLNEGLATYNEAIWIESQRGYKDYKENILTEAEKYLSRNPGWSIYEKSWEVFPPGDSVLYNVAISYSKASCVLHLLRYVLGDSIFFNSLYAYTANPFFKYGNISTPEFVNLMNEVSGKDLNWFFDEWIYKPNHPIYQNNYNIKEISSGRWKVDYTINQIQKNTVFFKMPVQLKVDFKDGKDTIMKVNNDYISQMFSFEFNIEPEKVFFDPNNEIVLKEVK